MSTNNNYIEEKFNHIDTKLDGKFGLVEQKLDIILEKYVELSDKYRELEKETESIRVFVKNKSILILSAAGIFSLIGNIGLGKLLAFIK